MSDEIIENTLEPELTLRLNEAVKIIEQVMSETSHENRDTQTLPHIGWTLKSIIESNSERL